MPNIKEFDAGNIGLRPSEVGVEARAGTARRVGAFSNQLAGAEDLLAAETGRLASQTENLGRQTEGVGRQTEGVGRQQQQLGSETEREGSIKGQALDNIGRRAGSAIEVAGDMAVKALDHQQISHGAQTFASLTEQATNDWNETVKNADPNDPTVAKKFLDGLNDRLDKFKNDGFYTENAQQWAEAHTDALRTHFVEKTTADMSTLAGQAARVNTAQTINSLSNTVYSDPSSLDFSLAALKSTTEGTISSSPNLSGAQAGAVRSEILQKGAESIVKSAAIGYIEKTGHVPAWASDPKYAPYINGAELKQFEKAAEVQRKANSLADKQAVIAQRQLDDQAVHAGTNKILTDNVTIDGTTGRPIISPKIYQDALELAKKYPNAPSASTAARTIMDWGEAQQKPPVVATDPAVSSSLDQRMFATENPTSTMDVLRAEADHKITRADADVRTKIIDQRDKMPADPQFKMAMDGAKELIEGRTAGEKSLQSGKYATFMQQFLGDYQRLKAAGTLPPNALSLRDPNSLLSKTMEAYKSPLAAAIGGNGGIASPPPPAAAAASEPKGPQPGDVRKGNDGMFRFKGGDPRKKENWEPIS